MKSDGFLWVSDAAWKDCMGSACSTDGSSNYIVEKIDIECLFYDLLQKKLK